MDYKELFSEIKEKQAKSLKDAQDALSEIQATDPMFFESLASLLTHISQTYSDKYEEAQPYVDNMWLKYGEGQIPAGHNIGQAVNYLKRYLSQGHEKSYKPDDLKKSIHFSLFELTRRLHE
jgi:hypothetical protein